MKHLFVLDPGVLDSTSEEEVEATVHGLEEVGLYHMPYERDVYIQINAGEMIGANPAHELIYGPFGRDQTVRMEVNATDLGVAKSVPIDWDASKLAQLLVVLLATRNADKVTTVNKLAKLGIGKGHRFSHTTRISLPGTLSNDADNPPKGSKVAPHLRRGHVRLQRYGEGNKLEKKIWIAPVFVNADPDFVASRTRYRISMPALNR